MRDMLWPFQEFLDFCRNQSCGVARLNGSSGNALLEEMTPSPLSAANLVCSDRQTDGQHIPVLDLDVDAMLIPSSTPGHHHLFIDKPMSWKNYEKLLDVLAEVGILEQGYVDVSKKRKRTQVRTPWTRKGK